MRLLKEADRVNAPLHDIQPEKTLTGAVKGVTVDQVEQLKKMALRSVTDQAQGTGADGGKHPSAVTGAVHEEAAGRSAAAAEA